MPYYDAFAGARGALRQRDGIAEDRKGWVFRTARGNDATR
jgi:hypothetical protein